jgi:hypothetical protein
MNRIGDAADRQGNNDILITYRIRNTIGKVESKTISTLSHSYHLHS